MKQSKIMEFKEINKHPDYLINANGIVKDKRTNKLVLPKINILGRPSVILNDKNYSLDMLVALNFYIEGEGFILRYKDNDITNVKADNLYWYDAQEESDVETIINEINKKKMEKEMNKAFYEARDKRIYVISKEGEVIGEYNGCAELDKKYNKNRFFNSYKSTLKFSSLLNGYIVDKKNWNEEKRQEILNKERRKHPNRQSPNKFKDLDKTILLINGDNGEIIKEYKSSEELDGIVFFGASKARQKISKKCYVNNLGGYLVYKRNWNEEYKQLILEKERIRHKPRTKKNEVEQPELTKEIKPITKEKTNVFGRIFDWFKGLFNRKKK